MIRSSPWSKCADRRMDLVLDGVGGDVQHAGLGALAPFGRTLDLDQAAEAHRIIERRENLGKVVLRVGG